MGCEVPSPQLQALNAVCKLVCTCSVCRKALSSRRVGVQRQRQPVDKGEGRKNPDSRVRWADHMSEVHVDSWKERDAVQDVEGT